MSTVSMNSRFEFQAVFYIVALTKHWIELWKWKNVTQLDTLFSWFKFNNNYKFLFSSTHTFMNIILNWKNTKMLVHYSVHRFRYLYCSICCSQFLELKSLNINTNINDAVECWMVSNDSNLFGLMIKFNCRRLKNCFNRWWKQMRIGLNYDFISVEFNFNLNSRIQMT